jgi:GTP-binding protein
VASSFIDVVELQVIAGDGGDGCVSFRREKFVPRGGPDGGDGGKGGDIIVRADSHLATLIDYKYKRIIKAARGSYGKGKNMHGRDAADVVVRVPVGTVIKDAATGDVMYDLVRPCEVVVARGGRGGRGNAAFATSTDRAPRRFDAGRQGETRRIGLEVKLIADVGIVGQPNVGKSSLLRKLTKARPKIGDYPFTTLSPNLGVLNLGDRDIVLADIPGLIEGAHSGKGLGHEFLRHIERTRVLLFLVDATRPSPLDDLEILRSELALHSRDLTAKPYLVAANKVDLLTAAQVKRLEKQGAIPISALAGTGLRPLVKAIISELKKTQEEGDVDGMGEGS